MILYPAIDLKEGKCVRLFQGDMEQATVFSDNPGEQAAAFEAAGFEWLHVVDLDGAFQGKPANEKAVRSILSQVNIPIQLGGGLRSVDIIGRWLDAGVARVILGTVAQKNPLLVKEACRLFPDQVAVGIDARGGMVATEGWANTTGTTAIEMAEYYEDAGACALIYTDIARDGTMDGPNIEETLELAGRITTPVIASGGIGSIEDIAAYKRHSTYGVEGLILGKALYDGRLNAKDALEAAKDPDA